MCNIILPTEQISDMLSVFAIRKSFRKKGKAILNIDANSKAFIVPSKPMYNKLGKANAIVLVCSNISINYNPTPEKAERSSSRGKYYWDYEYKFGKVETMLMTDLVKVLGKSSIYEEWSGHPKYLK